VASPRRGSRAPVPPEGGDHPVEEYPDKASGEEKAEKRRATTTRGRGDGKISAKRGDAIR